MAVNKQAIIAPVFKMVDTLNKTIKTIIHLRRVNTDQDLLQVKCSVLKEILNFQETGITHLLKVMRKQALILK
jgi:hypothetical protein